MSSTPFYDSAGRRTGMVAELRELVRYQDLLRLLISQLTRNRYRRSALGVLWTLLNPLISMAVLTIAFSTVFKTSAHYPVYLLSGLVCWNFFSQTTLYSMTSLSSAGGLIKRVYVPPTIFGVAAIGNALVNFAFSLVPLVLIMAILGQPFHATWWFVPVPVLLLAAFTLGMTLLLSTLAVFFADVVDMFSLLLQSWFFLTPVMYPLDVLPPESRGLMNLNPMYHLVEIFRAPVIEGRLPDLDHLAWGAGWAGFTLLAGWFTITRKAREFAYRI